MGPIRLRDVRLRSAVAAALLLASLAFATLPRPCASQRGPNYPLQGQKGADAPPGAGTGPGGKPARLDVAVSTLLERIIEIHVMDNSYQAIWWVVLTWHDPAAAAAVAASTGSYLAANATGACSRPCDSSQLAVAGCCDGIWLPHIEMPNLIGYAEEQLPRYRINVNATSGLVTWSTRLVGNWYAPLDFRAYPFDHQHLLLELALADSQATGAGLRWEHVAKLNNTAHTKGADLSGWRVKWGKGKLYDSRACQAKFGVAAPSYALAAAPNGSEPDALPLAVFSSIDVNRRYFANNSGQGSASPPDCGSYEEVYDEGRALYGPVVLVADVMVKRVASYYVVANFLPTLIISLVVFVVYCMPCEALGDRLVVVMTLMLALTALQFVFEFPPANYINALQQLVLVSYVTMLITCIESLIVNRIVVMPQQVRNMQLCQIKYEKLLRGLLLRRHSATSVAAMNDAITVVAAAGAAAGSLGRGRVYSRTGSPLQRNRIYARGRTSSGRAGSGRPGSGLAGAPTTQNSIAHADAAAVSAAAAAVIEAAAAAAATGLERSSGSSSTTATTSRGSSSDALARLSAGTAGTAADAATTTVAAGSPVSRSGSKGPMQPPPADSATAAAAQQQQQSLPPQLGLQQIYQLPLPPLVRQEQLLRNNFKVGAGASFGSAAAVQEKVRFAPPNATVVRVYSNSTDVEAPSAADEQEGSIRANNRTGDAVASAQASLAATAAAEVNAFTNPVRVAGPGCLRSRLWLWLCGCGLVLRSWGLAVVRAPGGFYNHCKEDAEFAWFVASRIDKWCGLVCFVLYCVTISVLMWVQTQVGDHKLMLGDTPGNM